MFQKSPAFVLTITGIDDILENQNNKLQFHYQEAITATISHEQMNPLNSIVNFSDCLYQRFCEYLPVEAIQKIEDFRRGGENEDDYSDSDDEDENF